MRRLALAIVLPVALAAQESQPRPELAQIVARHTASLGDAAALCTGNVHLFARATTGGRQYRVRILVQREPFGYREEWLPEQPEQGEGRIFVSDGRHAWLSPPLLTPDQPGRPLTGQGAITVLEHAFCDGLLYLDPRFTTGRANFDARHELGMLRELPPEIERGVRVDQAHFVTTAGTVLLFQFDAKDGRLLEIADIDNAAWFVRFGRWQEFGSLRLPALRIAGRFDERAQQELDVMEIDEVRLVDRHPDGFFSGSPAQPLAPAMDAGPLRLLPHTVPGHAHVVVTDMRVGSQPGVVMLVDTGADGCAVTPLLARAQRLLPLGRQTLVTANGIVETRRAWIDELVFGERRVLQLPASCIELPALYQLPPDQRPGFLLGGAELFPGSPVLDFAAGRLWLRGTPVVPLARFAGRGKPREQDAERIVTLPFARAREGSDTIEVEFAIGGKRMAALLDTGFPAPLRLHAEVLGGFGLPATRAEWLARGALPTTSVGVGGAASDDLFAVLPEVRLGPLVLEQPIVQLVFLPAARAHRAIVGCGALLCCTRVGLDDQRQVVELELGGMVVRGASGTWRVPVRGLPLGLVCGSPAVRAREWPFVFPSIPEVAAGSAAAKAGITTGDRLVAIDGVSCERVPAWSFNPKLWLQPGTRVELTLRAGNAAERKVLLP